MVSYFASTDPLDIGVGVRFRISVHPGGNRRNGRRGQIYRARGGPILMPERGEERPLFFCLIPSLL